MASSKGLNTTQVGMVVIFSDKSLKRTQNLMVIHFCKEDNVTWYQHVNHVIITSGFCGDITCATLLSSVCLARCMLIIFR